MAKVEKRTVARVTTSSRRRFMDYSLSRFGPSRPVTTARAVESRGTHEWQLQCREPEKFDMRPKWRKRCVLGDVPPEECRRRIAVLARPACTNRTQRDWTGSRSD